LFDGVASLNLFLINIFILNQYLLIPGFFVIIFFNLIIKNFKEFCSESKRLELKEKGPIYDFMIDSVRGTVAVKIYNIHKMVEDIFFNKYLANMAICNYNFVKAFRITSFYFEFFALLFQIASMYILINTINQDNTGNNG